MHCDLVGSSEQSFATVIATQKNYFCMFTENKVGFCLVSIRFPIKTDVLKVQSCIVWFACMNYGRLHVFIRSCYYKVMFVTANQSVMSAYLRNYKIVEFILDKTRRVYRKLFTDIIKFLFRNTLAVE